MKRRTFIAGLGAASAAAAARAQTMPVIGMVGAGARSGFEDLLASFRLGLKDVGRIEGQSVAIEYRFADGRFDQMPRLASELAQRDVAVMISTGVGSALAIKGASSTIPHVFLSHDDPVKFGLVSRLNRPGGNATGVAPLTAELTAKRVELARLLMPKGARLAYLMNPPAPEAPRYLDEVQEVARAISQELVVLNASTPEQIDAALQEVARQRAGALIISTDGYFFSRREQIITLAARDKMPAIYDRRGYAVSGGLVSYGTDLAGAFRQMGVYAGRILNGEKPADLPVVQSARFELIVNLRTAKALGIDLPAQVLALANEVIE
jgi:putative ABC transport system substrate-binding protein